MRTAVELRWKDWPESDRALWESLVRRGGLLDDAGALSHLRAATLRTLRSSYGRWLAWLLATDADYLDEAPEDRARPERLRDWLISMEPLAPASRSTFLNSPIRILSTAFPGNDWSTHYRLRRGALRITSRHQSRRKVGRIKASSVLLEAGLELAGPQAEAKRSALGKAKCRRDGTMIAFLALLPIRRRALASLELGTSVLVADDHIDIVLSSEMTKTGQPWEARVPQQIEPLLRRYIIEVRPYLLSRGKLRHSVLWVDRMGKPFELDYLTRKIRQITKRAVGVGIPPHFFRDAAATTLCRLSPSHARHIAPLLGHSNLETAERHYIQATSVEAGRQYTEVIARLRGEPN